MRKTLLVALLVAAGAALGGTVLRNPIAYAATNVPQMFVSNDSAHAVPVREQNLDAGNNLRVHEQGTANVNVTNTYDPARSAITASVLDQIDPGVIAQLTGTGWYSVPAGKRLVIQYVGGGCGEEITSATLLTTYGTGDDAILIPWPLEINAAHDVTQPVTIYVEPGTGDRIAIGRNSSTGTAFCRLHFSGYLVSV